MGILSLYFARGVGIWPEKDELDVLVDIIITIGHRREEYDVCSLGELVYYFC